MPPKQETLPADEFQTPPYWKQIDEAAREYAHYRDLRIKAGNDEKAAMDRLKTLIDFHGIKFSDNERAVEFNGVRLEKKADVKIKVVVEPEPMSESDPDQEAIDGTVHPEDEEESNPELAADLLRIRQEGDERIAAADEAA